MAHARMRSFSSLFLFSILLFGSGCSSGTPTLTLHPTSGKVAFAQTFNRAYCGKSSDGSYACVLVADDAPGRTAAGAGKAPLTPGSQQPLRQVVHIKILWRPLNGTRESALANATLDWYVLSNTADGSDDLLLYQGSAYVALSPDDKTTKVTIRSAQMRPAMVRGLSDPVGDATITGSFTAVNDNQQCFSLARATRQRTAVIASSSQ